MGSSRSSQYFRHANTTNQLFNLIKIQWVFLLMTLKTFSDVCLRERGSHATLQPVLLSSLRERAALGPPPAVRLLLAASL